MPKELLTSLFSGNETFASNIDKNLLTALSKTQTPKIFWLGCSDSRVPESTVTSQPPGQIFVHRNIANCFHPHDSSALAALAYAVSHLGVEHIVVCGHTSCGGCAAAWASASARSAQARSASKDEGEEVIARWLAPIRALAVGQMRATRDEPVGQDEAMRRLVESHVCATVSNIASSSVVQKAWANKKPLQIHGLVYDLATGRLQNLDVDEGPQSPISP